MRAALFFLDSNPPEFPREVFLFDAQRKKHRVQVSLAEMVRAAIKAAGELSAKKWKSRGIWWGWPESLK